MATFPLQQNKPYAIAFRHGGGTNIEFIERDNRYNLITGCLFAVNHKPVIYINEAEILSATEIPEQEIERLLRVSEQQNKEWQEYADKVGVKQDHGQYV